MNPHSNRLNAAVPAVLLLIATSGCNYTSYTVLPDDKSQLELVVPLNAVHDAVEAAAATAPAAAETSYNNLRRDFNDFVSREEAAVTSVGASPVVVKKVELNESDLSSDPNIRRDLAEFAAAAPSTPSGPVLAGMVNASDVLKVRIYPPVDAIVNSRSDQAATINRVLESLKLAPWETVNKQSAGTR
jgi:hypothetical protein